MDWSCLVYGWPNGADTVTESKTKCTRPSAEAVTVKVFIKTSKGPDHLSFRWDSV